MDAVNDFQAILAQAGITPDKPLHATLMLVHNATLALDAKIDAFELQPPADIERAVRASLTGLRPVYEKRWRWQRWAMLGAAFVAGATTMAFVCASTWALASAVARHDANAEVARWQAWWAATCGDQSPHRIIIAGKPVCQVPME
jgi:hypothetical protein